MENKKQATIKKSSVKYRSRVPQKVLKKLTPEVRRQYFIWDEILKRQIEKYPTMLFPLIREIFGREYPDDTEIRFLSTEYIVPKVYGQGQKLLESIRSDLLIQIGGKDLYHMECQMERGGDIAVRMLEYDLNSALVHGLKKVPTDEKKCTMKFEVTLPQSAILYLDSAQDLSPSSTESCIIVYPDGTRYEYRVPVLNAQGYTPEMVEEKNLTVLIPFLMIRFRKRFESILKKKADKTQTEMETLKKDLTKMAADCIMIINREEENGRMSSRMGSDILELIGKVCDYLFKKEPELLKEVHEVMEPAIKLHSEELEERIAMQQEKLKEKDIQLTQMDEQLTQHIKNCIHLYKKNGKTKMQAEQALQEIFSLTMEDVEKLLEKY